MKKKPEALLACGMLFSVALVLSNIVAAKVVQTPIPFAGGRLVFPGAVFCYAITFLVTDIVGEVWGRREAALIVRWGFVAQVAGSLLLLFTQVLPAADPAMQGAYDALLGQNGVFVAASLAAYLMSQSWDVFVFHRIRDAFMARSRGGAHWRWIWNNASTMTSQIIDTVVFLGLAFGLGKGWLFDAGMRPVLWSLMLGQYAVKLVLAALDTPFFYLFTRKPDRP